MLATLHYPSNKMPLTAAASTGRCHRLSVHEDSTVVATPYTWLLDEYPLLINEHSSSLTCHSYQSGPHERETKYGASSIP